jgi:hypothetical protein
MGRLSALTRVPRRVARRLTTGGRLSILSGNLTKLGRKGRIPARGAVGDVVEPRSVGVRLEILFTEFVHHVTYGGGIAANRSSKYLGSMTQAARPRDRDTQVLQGH